MKHTQVLTCWHLNRFKKRHKAKTIKNYSKQDVAAILGYAYEGEQQTIQVVKSVTAVLGM